MLLPRVGWTRFDDGYAEYHTDPKQPSPMRRTVAQRPGKGNKISFLMAWGGSKLLRPAQANKSSASIGESGDKRRRSSWTR